MMALTHLRPAALVLAAALSFSASGNAICGNFTTVLEEDDEQPPAEKPAHTDDNDITGMDFDVDAEPSAEKQIPRNRPSESRAVKGLDCRQDKARDEVAICNNSKLLAHERSVVKLYGEHIKGSIGAAKAAHRAAQKNWLRERRRCGSDEQCLLQHYENRLAELGKPIARSPTQPRVVDSDAGSHWVLYWDKGNRPGKWSYGFGRNAPRSVAQDVANAACSKHSNQCQLTGFGKRPCFALAVTNVGSGMGFAEGDSAYSAKARSVLNCLSVNPRSECTVQHEHCAQSDKQKLDADLRSIDGDYWAVAIGEVRINERDVLRNSADVGVVVNSAEEAVAKYFALRNCGQGCKIVGSGKGGCVAVAFGSNTPTWGFSTGANDWAAKQRAERLCDERSGGRGCNASREHTLCNQVKRPYGRNLVDFPCLKPLDEAAKSYVKYCKSASTSATCWVDLRGDDHLHPIRDLPFDIMTCLHYCKDRKCEGRGIPLKQLSVENSEAFASYPHTSPESKVRGEVRMEAGDGTVAACEISFSHLSAGWDASKTGLGVRCSLSQ